MERAIELSKRGFPAPNPHVGCVIVKNGEIVGEGWHDHAGGPHAEADALDRAGDLAHGADVYVTLEPCNHQGRTPPCSQALIRSGVSRVFIANHDPNPRAGGGADALRAAGVHVEVGLCAEEAESANHVFLTAMRRKRPFVVAKAAVTSDGFIARSDGTSKWITGEEARAVGHRLRAEMGCVLVGWITAHLDDPELTARIPGVVNQPLRVVLDPLGMCNPKLRLFTDGHRTVRFVHGGRATRPDDVELASDDGGFAIADVLETLFQMGVIGVLVEGGAETLASFFRQGLVDRLEKFTSPKTFGEGLHWLGKDPPEVRLERLLEEHLGDDLHETFAVRGNTSSA